MKISIWRLAAFGHFPTRSTMQAYFIVNLGKEREPLQEYDRMGKVVPQVLQTKAPEAHQTLEHGPVSISEVQKEVKGHPKDPHWM